MPTVNTRLSSAVIVTAQQLYVRATHTLYDRCQCREPDKDLKGRNQSLVTLNQDEFGEARDKVSQGKLKASLSLEERLPSSPMVSARRVENDTRMV